MRLALGVEYNGRNYHGWQRQEGVSTVQATLEAALAQLADHPVAVICAGRTDTGVHATGQVIHFDTSHTLDSRSLTTWVRGANTLLPSDICIRSVTEVDERFHARFSAIARCYEYKIDNRPMRSAILPTELTWCRLPLDAGRMHEAAQALIGQHDFTSYRAVACQAKTPYRCVEYINVTRAAEQVVIKIRANAFLHHMVRNIAGVLVKIGEGAASVGWAGEVLAKRNRCEGGVTAKPQGLYLTQVVYPDAVLLN